MNTPVLLLVFNRPDLLKKQINALRKVQPSRIFVSADGARIDRDTDRELCSKVQQVIREDIDWDCEVIKRYLEKNLGCGVAPSTGISWFFEHVDEGIILEDDCIPDPSFFAYCQQLLEKYRCNESVMSINGGHFPMEPKPIFVDKSYYFSHYPHLWGWATWKRAWSKFAFSLGDVDTDIANGLFDGIVDIPRACSDWRKKFKSVADGQCKDIWDYQWVYACWKSRGLSILPSTNMVENIGFGEDSTHTFDQENYDSLPSQSINFPLLHPDNMNVSRDIDSSIERSVFLRKGMINILKYGVELLLPISLFLTLKRLFGILKK